MESSSAAEKNFICGFFAVAFGLAAMALAFSFFAADFGRDLPVAPRFLPTDSGFVAVSFNGMFYSDLCLEKNHA